MLQCMNEPYQCISFMRGDTYTAQLMLLTEQTGEPYLLGDQDTGRLMVFDSSGAVVVRKEFSNENQSENGTVSIKFAPSDTENISEPYLYYEVEAETADGDIFTLLFGEFMLGYDMITSGSRTQYPLDEETVSTMGIPVPTQKDSGKILSVVNGGYKLTEPCNWEGLKVDSELSATSENLVQNKVIKAALDGKQPCGDYALRSELPEVKGLASEDYVEQYAQPKGDYLTAETDPTVPDWAKQAFPPSYTAGDVNADPAGTAASVAASHNVDQQSHNDIRLLISELTKRFNALADSDDIDLDQLSEIITYIQDNRDLIDTVTTSKIGFADIVDNVTTNVGDKPLSAAQGVALKGLIDAITVPTKLSELSDDQQHRTVTDTEKTAWNNKSNFSGDYNELDNLPSIPDAVSQLENDAGYIAVSINTFESGSAISIPSGYSEYRASADVSAFTVTYPSDSFETWMRFTTAASGDISVTLPLDTVYINEQPTFSNGETWEISVKDGIAVAAKTA